MKSTKKKTKEQFLEQCLNKFGSKYDYSKVEYINTKTKVCIICPIHGEFWQTPEQHLKGKGCPKCLGKNLTTQDWVKQANIVHNNKYIYSKTNFKKGHEKVIITCPIHGDFEQQATSHLQGNGCPRCKDEKIKASKSKGTEQFIQEAKKVHGNKYNYDKTDYVNNRTKVVITCPVHGDFEQIPYVHLQGSGCSKCNKFCVESKGEKIIKEYLTKNKIKFIAQYGIAISKSINQSGSAFIDFYLPDYNMFIEYNGAQHYKDTTYFTNYDFVRQQKRDAYVQDYCQQNNITLLTIKYTLKEFQILQTLSDKLAESK